MILSREEFWVMDILAQLNCRVAVSTFDRPDASLVFNKRAELGLSRTELVDLFFAMQKQRDIVIFPENRFTFKFDWNDSHRVPVTRTVVDYTPVWKSQTFFSKSEILSDLEDVDLYRKKYKKRNAYFCWEPFPKVDHRLFCCATVQGTEKWEKMAQVDWSQFLDYEGSLPEGDADVAENQSLMYYRAAACSEKTLDAFFEWKLRWDAHPDSMEQTCFRRCHTERISPWRATYWKTFSEGFECDYSELTVHRDALTTLDEDTRYHVYFERSWKEYNDQFDWCNGSVKDFPFQGD